MKRLCSYFTVTAIIFALFTELVVAQSHKPETDSKYITKYEDWAVQCDDVDNTLSCFMFQRILVKDSGDSLLRMTVDRPQDLSAPRAIFVIPLGAYVKPGISIQIDENEPRNLEIEYCDKQGCYGGTLLNKSILDSLKRGRQIMVTFQTRSRQEIQLPISLFGFSSGLAALY